MNKIALAGIGIACADVLSAPLANADNVIQYVKTVAGWGCLINTDQVMCETGYGDEEVVTAQGVYSMLHASGIQNPDMQQLADGQTYHLNGWTVVASGG